MPHLLSPPPFIYLSHWAYTTARGEGVVGPRVEYPLPPFSIIVMSALQLRHWAQHYIPPKNNEHKNEFQLIRFLYSPNCETVTRRMDEHQYQATKSRSLTDGSGLFRRLYFVRSDLSVWTCSVSASATGQEAQTSSRLTPPSGLSW
ncbi:hypothetical protein NDU88_005427 [Pleurodeles waltl]|uniref:Uncharacterized protein n=1 Tax=Pleurodeles waltl TaxID=8319 RepID=A0AAV7PFQ2_PLEWA|nr:hypothetical protein NDU88_005427 [Pleurodeles waltl]